MSSTYNQNRFSRQTSQAVRIRVERRGDKFRVQFTADEFSFSNLVADLKLYVSVVNREFIPESRCWSVTAEAENELRQWLELAEREFDARVLWVEAVQ